MMIPFAVVSNHSEAMAEAFGKHVFGFMKKPISYCELRNRIETILDDMADDIEVSYTRSERNTKIRTLEILYIKSYGRYTYLTLTHKKDPIFSDISISKWKGELERHGFYQCHRSFLWRSLFSCH